MSPAHTEYVRFEFDGVADIVIAADDWRSLEFWPVDTEDGWGCRVDEHFGRRVKIVFRPTNDRDEAEFVVPLEAVGPAIAPRVSAPLIVQIASRKRGADR